MGLVEPTDWLAKVKLVADKVTTGVAKPLPLSMIVCGLFAALSMMVTVPYRLPSAAGVKVTVMVQVPDGATLEPQLFSSAKSPLAAMDVMLRFAVPVFVRVTTSAALVLPST